MGSIPIRFRQMLWVSCMGLMHITVALKNLSAPNAVYEADFLVDTGATDFVGSRLRFEENWCRTERQNGL